MSNPEHSDGPWAILLDRPLRRSKPEFAQVLCRQPPGDNGSAKTPSRRIERRDRLFVGDKRQIGKFSDPTPQSGSPFAGLFVRWSQTDYPVPLGTIDRRSAFVRLRLKLSVQPSVFIRQLGITLAASLIMPRLCHGQLIYKKRAR